MVYIVVHLLPFVYPPTDLPKLGTKCWPFTPCCSAVPLVLPETHELFAGLVMLSKTQCDAGGLEAWMNGAETQRSRKDQDRARLLFRSLAEAQDRLAEGDETLYVDEDILDTLDVLSHGQPEEAMMVKVPEEFFRPFLKTLPLLPRLESLHVKHEDMKYWIQFLLIFMPKLDSQDPDPEALQREVVNLMRTLSRDGSTTFNWETFKSIISNAEVYPFLASRTVLLTLKQPKLLDGLDNLINCFFEDGLPLEGHGTSTKLC